jgi:hypothetical protein
MVSNVYAGEAGVEVAKSNGAATVEPTAGAHVEEPHELLAKAPPSARDFQVYERAVVEESHTRAVAKEYKISQTRVCQVIARVRRWIGVVVGTAPCDLTPEQQLQMAIGLAADRLDHLYRSALYGWNASCEFDLEKTTILPNGSEITTATAGFGDPRFLTAAGRLAVMRSKLPTDGLLIDALAATAETADKPLPEEEEATSPANPPQEDCSPNTSSWRAVRETRRQMPNATGDVARRYDAAPDEALAARRAFFGPVQEDRMIHELAQLVRGKQNGREVSGVEILDALFPPKQEGSPGLKS